MAVQPGQEPREEDSRTNPDDGGAGLPPLSEERSALQELASSLRSKQDMKLDELLKEYDPYEPGCPITAELAGRMERILGRNPRVVVIGANGKVNAEMTAQLVEDALRGDSDLPSIEVEQRIMQPLRFGELPAQIVSIHPITGEALRSSGQDTLGLNWDQCDLACKQLLSIAVDEGELENALSTRDMREYYRMARGEGELASLQAEFPQAAIAFQQLKEVGDLPSLRAFRDSFRNEDSDRVFRATKI